MDTPTDGPSTSTSMPGGLYPGEESPLPTQRKRTADTTAEGSSKSNTSVDRSDHDPTAGPTLGKSQAWIPQKIRAIAGPNQVELDEERAARKVLQQQVTELRSLLANAQEASAAHGSENALLQRTISEMQISAANREQELLRNQEDLEQLEVTAAILTRDKELLSEQIHRALEEKTNAVRFAMHSRGFNLEQAARQEQALSSLQQEKESQNALINSLRTERDDALREKAEYETEIQSIRNAAPAVASPNPSTSQNASSVGESATNQLNISRIIEETVAKCIAAQTSQDGPASPRRSTARRPTKPGSVAHTAEVKRQALASVDGKEAVWKDLLRGVFRTATGSPAISKFEHYNPVDQATAELFAEGKGPGPEGGNKFRLYFGDGWRGAAWNRAIISNMYPLVVAAHAESRVGGSCMSALGVEACVWGFITQARTSWKSFKPRVHESGSRYETETEAVSRARIYNIQRTTNIKYTNRKYAKFQERRKAVGELLQDATAPMDKSKWQLVKSALDAMNADAMSSDNTDTESESDSGQDEPRPPPRLQTTVPHYRHRVLSDIFHDLDTSQKKLLAKKARRAGKRYIPKPTRPRDRTGVVSERTVARQLPRSLYDPQFLSTLNPREKEEVGVKDEPVPHFDQWIALQTVG
ncbi:hypothetical protein VNI00_013877 [Paramarasmius palmivorus]|uniref:Uncharacterized protein n=1 Tax=Paramarasmius palmivorus TaxID=297713 RepID=A0AAW0BVU0_9AGAR